MLARALDAGTPAAWVTGDEVYGQDPALRADLIKRGVAHVLAVSRDHRVVTGIGTRRAVEIAVRLPKRAWHRLSAGAGAKGHRWYDWALVALTDPQGGLGHHHLLIRRNRRTGELAFYRTWAPRPVPLRAGLAERGQRRLTGGARHLTRVPLPGRLHAGRCKIPLGRLQCPV